MKRKQTSDVYGVRRVQDDTERTGPGLKNKQAAAEAAQAGRGGAKRPGDAKVLQWESNTEADTGLSGINM